MNGVVFARVWAESHRLLLPNQHPSTLNQPKLEQLVWVTDVGPQSCMDQMIMSTKGCFLFPPLFAFALSKLILRRPNLPLSPLKNLDGDFLTCGLFTPIIDCKWLANSTSKPPPRSGKYSSTGAKISIC